MKTKEEMAAMEEIVQDEEILSMNKMQLLASTPMQVPNYICLFFFFSFSL